MSDYYDYYKSHGICVDCGQEQAKRGYVRCWRCLANRRERDVERIAEKSDDERKAIQQRKADWVANVRQQRIDSGLCPDCGGEIADKKHKTCEKCRARKRKVGNKKRRADGIVSREFRGDGYFCVTCLKPVEHEGDKLCERCKANNARTIKIATAARNNADHPWRQLSNGQYKLYMAKKKWKEGQVDRERV